MYYIMTRLNFKVHLPWMVLMLIISIQSSISSIDVPQLGITFMDKILHFFIFGVLGVLIIRGMLLNRINRALIWTMIIGATFAMLDEWHQFYVPGRDASVDDFIADVLGILTFSMIYYGYYHKKKRRALVLKKETEPSVS